MTTRAASLASAAAWLLVSGLTVGLLAGHWAAGSGASACPAGTPGLACLELTRSLAIRVGLFTGAMTMIVVTTWAGILRMAVLDEHRRAVMASESGAGRPGAAS